MSQRTKQVVAKKNLVLSALFLIAGLHMLSMVIYLKVEDTQGDILTLYSILLISFSALVYKEGK